MLRETADLIMSLCWSSLIFLLEGTGILLYSVLKYAISNEEKVSSSTSSVNCRKTGLYLTDMVKIAWDKREATQRVSENGF